MSISGSSTSSAHEIGIAQRLVDQLQNDLRSLCTEAKRKNKPVTDAAENGLMRVKTIIAKYGTDVQTGLLANSSETFAPFLLACETKQPRLVTISLPAIQRLIQAGCATTRCAESIVAVLWQLMDAHTEELRLLQTAALLVNAGGDVAMHDTLAKALVLCFRLHFAKDQATANTAAATIKQLVSVVFERAMAEDKENNNNNNINTTSNSSNNNDDNDNNNNNNNNNATVPQSDEAVEQQSQQQPAAESVNTASTLPASLTERRSTPPKTLRPFASDAYMLFQDFCFLINGEPPRWLTGITEMTRTLCLELIESSLFSYSPLFLGHPEFCALIKDRVCPLVIRLFSPNIKPRMTSSPSVNMSLNSNSSPLSPGGPGSSSAVSAPGGNSVASTAATSSSHLIPGAPDKAYFPITNRVMRIVHTLIRYYFHLMLTESEIFLSLLAKLTDSEKPAWQRVLAVEVIASVFRNATLVRSIVMSYDSKAHSTKILADLVSALAAFIQSCFLGASSMSTSISRQSLNDSQASNPTVASNPSLPGGNSAVAPVMFVYRGVSVPLLFLPTQHPAKPLLLEMLDKSEVSVPVPEGYGATVAFCALLDLVSTCQALIERPHSVLSSDVQLGNESDEQDVSQQMISSIWGAILAALSLMLESSTDESAGEAILKAMQAIASVAGQLNLPVPRDAFVTALCKASLPPYYTLTILNTAAFGQAAASKVTTGGSPNHPQSNELTPPTNADQASAVVAVGSPLLCSSLILGPVQGPIVLTSRNIQCMRAVLSLAHCHGSVLGPAWHLVLATLQHLCYILGLRPAVGGSLRADRPVAADIALPPGSSITQMGVQSDLPILAAMLSRLFESSQYLDEVALHHLLTALCNLSHECMEVAYAANREPSLFPIAKLLETGLVNLPRLEILWKPLTNHLLEVCQHPNSTLRSYGVEAIVSLVRSAVAFQHNPPLRENKRLLTTILTPIVELSSTAASGSAASANADVRARQLDCLMHIVQSQGPLLSGVWSLILGVVGDINPQHGDALVRQSFRCLQIVTTDHLATLDADGLAQCIDTVARFCSQQADLNISLTAVGLLWAIVDHLSSQSPRDKPLEPVTINDGSTTDYPPEDALWMRVYRKLGDLCIDTRPPLRKSAAQTLFEALAAHTDRLRLQTLADLLWTVVFPLMDSVRLQAGVLPTLSESTQQQQQQQQQQSGNESVSASTTSAEAKVWAEAHTVIISGASRLFANRQRVIRQMDGSVEAWAALLDHIASLAGGAMVPEVSHSAVRALLELCSSAWNNGSSPSTQDMAVFSASDQPDLGIARRSTVEAAERKHQQSVSSFSPDRVPYDNAWPAWLFTARRFIKPTQSVTQLTGNTTSSSATQPPTKPEVPTQQKLIDLTKALVHLLPKIMTYFTPDDARKLVECLGGLVAVPVAAEAAPFVLPLNYEPVLTQLHEGVVAVLQIQQEGLLAGQVRHLLVPHFNGLLTLSDMTVLLPPFPWSPHSSFYTDQLPPIPAPQPRQIPAGLLPANVVPFGEQCLKLATTLFTSPNIAADSAVVNGRIFQRFLRSLRGPLRLKYGCPARGTWLQAFDSLMAVLSAGLPCAKKNPTSAEYVNVWPELGGLLEEFLFCKQSPPSNLSIDELARDEACDCRLVEIVQSELLPGATSCGLPREFVLQLMHILNKGSVHSTSTEAFIDLRTNRHLRLDFAKKCFDTLLRFSCLQSPTSPTSPGSPAAAASPTSLNSIALVALLDRCRSVVVNYAKDSRLSGELPLPRARSDEALLVLKALTMLIDWLIQAKSKNVSNEIWSKIIDLYPELIACTQVSNNTVTSAVLDVLLQYKFLLRPPTDFSS